MIYKYGDICMIWYIIDLNIWYDISLILICDIYYAIQGLEEAQLKYNLINSVSFFFWKKNLFFPVLGKYHDGNTIIKCNENLMVKSEWCRWDSVLAIRINGKCQKSGSASYLWSNSSSRRPPWQYNKSMKYPMSSVSKP